MFAALARMMPAVAKGAEAAAATSQATMRAFARSPQMMVQGFQTIRGMAQRGAYVSPAPNASGRDMRTGEQIEADNARAASAAGEQIEADNARAASAAGPQSPFRQQSWFQDAAQGLMNRVVVTPTEIGKATGAVGKFMSAPHEGAGAIGGFLAKEGLGVAASFVKLQQPIAPLAERIRDLGNEVIESKRNFQDLNGTYAAAFARLDVAREKGSIETARLTAGSSSFLVDQQIALEKALRPILASVENVKNTGLAVLIQATLGILEQVKVSEQVLGAILDKIPGFKQFKDLMDDIEKTNKGSDAAISAGIRGFIDRISKHAQGGGDPLRPPLAWGR
jgi:hypothetical protein